MLAGMAGTGRHRSVTYEEALATLHEDSDNALPPTTPVPPSPPPSRTSRPESAMERLDRIATSTRQTQKKLLAFLGSPPGALGEQGTGFVGLVFARFDALDEKADRSTEALEEVRAELVADRKAAEAREAARVAEEVRRVAALEQARAPWSRAAWLVIGVVITTLTVGALSALHSVFVAHWH